MSRFYSKRLLWPYTGVVQVADLGWARALSLDGKNWALRYAADEDEQSRHGPLSYDPRINCSAVVTLDGGQVKARADYLHLSPEQVQADAQRLFTALDSRTMPLAPGDRYEYWLLDGQDQSPLALLYSCVEAEEMELPAPPPEWRAMPAAELPIQDPGPTERGTPPVNYRLERLVDERSGPRPRAAWFQRREGDAHDFPPLLLREDWDDAEAQRLCALYLQRLAPRLLMLSGLTLAKRQWLQQAAREFPLDVERLYPLYPAEVDPSFINAARVAYRLLQTAQS